MSVTDNINSAARRMPVWVLYIIGAVWPFWLLYQAASGDMGPEPVKPLEHALGELGLQALILGLMITPLRKLAGINLIRFRRAIGVLTFYFVFTHLLVWVLLDVQILSEIWGDILKRPYITIGMAGFIIMTPLAVTSNNRSVRKLGAKWRSLHRLVYPTAVLAGVHYIMVGKTWQLESLIYMSVIMILLGTRMISASFWKKSRISG
jgi:sulfoxide reductase heme-binding subunit YedZ